MSEAWAVRVVAVDAAAGRSLRRSVLRPGDPPGSAMYPLEQDALTLHVAAIGEREQVLAVGSVMPEGHPRDPQANDWRIRGMATGVEMRGRGLGTRVLEAIEGAARERGAERLWCNARSGARDFYQRAGFEVEGGQFEIAGIGPHVLMVKPLS